MKKAIYFIFFQLLLFSSEWISIYAQNPCEKHISTNYLSPSNPYSFPQNRYNPWINSDFYIGKLDLGNPAKIELNNQLNWSNDFLSTASTTILKMYNPYTSDGTPGARYDYLHRIGVDFEFRDYKWEDGWELLWIGTGYYPNGEPVNVQNGNRAFAQAESNPGNSRVPYVILYNRYRGVMRVFMNLVTDFSSYSNVKTEINIQGAGNLSGILRHLEPLDRALDQTTNIDKIESFNPKPGDWNQWYSIDYNLGFDPCICGKNQEITIESFGIDEFHLEMYGRGISAEVPIIQNGQPNYDLDWLTQHDVNEGLEGGNRIFTTLDAMIEDYKDAMTQYQIENKAFQDYNERKAVLDGLKGFLVDGTIGLIPGGGTFKSWFLKPEGDGSNFENFIKGSGKGLLGYGYDQLSMGFNPKTSQPKPPDMPTASFSEIRFTGNIKGFSQPATIGPFFVPGSYDEQSSLTNLSSPYRYPAYNAPPGMSALLNTPEPLFNYSSPVNVEVTLPFQPYTCYREEEWSNQTSLRLRFDEELLIALNPSLDFDLNKTATYIHIEVTLEDNIPEYDGYRVDNFSVSQDGNFFLDFEKQTSNGREYTYKSRWILLEDLNQYAFSLDRNTIVDVNKNGIWSWDGLGYQCNPSTYNSDNPSFLASDLALNVKDVKMKILHDYYFDQIGSNGEQVNTTQVFSYLLYQEGTDINFLGNESEWSLPQNNLYNAYTLGQVEISNELISLSHPSVTGVSNTSVLLLNAQEVLITGDISTPYNSNTGLVISALEQIRLEPGAVLRPNYKHLQIKKDFYDVPTFTYISSHQLKISVIHKMAEHIWLIMPLNHL